MEDNDLYRFLIEGACNVYGVDVPRYLLDWWKDVPEFHEDEISHNAGLTILRREMEVVLPQLVWIAEGRSPWDVYEDVRMLGNSRVDPCSRILKRKLSEDWLAQNHNPRETILYLGIDWTEEHRFDNPNMPGKGAVHRWKSLGWVVEAPLCQEPLMSKVDANLRCLSAGVELPRLTRMGFAHNNCGGACSKAGQGHWAKVYEFFPDRYAFAEMREEGIRDSLNANVAMMKESAGKDDEGNPVSRPLPLKTLRQRIDAKGKIDKFDVGGCGCFLDNENEEEPELTMNGRS